MTALSDGTYLRNFTADDMAAFTGGAKGGGAAQTQTQTGSTGSTGASGATGGTSPAPPAPAGPTGPKARKAGGAPAPDKSELVLPDGIA